MNDQGTLLMRRDISYMDGVQIEEAAEITRHCFFRDDEMEDMERDLRSKEDFATAYRDWIRYWNYERCLAELFTQTDKEQFYYYGTCGVCNSSQPFIMDHLYEGREDGRIVPNWRERLVCPNCGCNGRERYMIDKVFSVYRIGQSVLVYEQRTNLFGKIQREIPNAVGFEYLSDGCSETADDIHYEDICNLSYADEQFDILLVNDKFAQTSDYQHAFVEACRVLKNGGKLIFTAPFNANSSETVKGDYQIFGWDVLESLRRAGFSDSVARTYYGLKKGYLGYLPIYFAAQK